MNRNEFADRLTAGTHFYFDRIAAPLLLGYVCFVTLAVPSLTPVTLEELRTWEGMATVFGPPLFVNCLAMYGWIVSDLVRETDVHQLQSELEFDLERDLEERR